MSDLDWNAKCSASIFPLAPLTQHTGTVRLYESLGSWLHRFYLHNGFVNVGSIFYPRSQSAVLGAAKASDAPTHVQARISLIAESTFQPPETIRRLLLEDKLIAFEGKSTVFTPRWLLSSKTIRSKGSSMRHAACPLCIAGFSDAAWLQHWRLATTTQCNVHGTMLLEACPDCNAPFVIHRHRHAPLDRCENCDLPFTHMPIERCDDGNKAPDFAMNVGRNVVASLPVPQQAEHHWWLGIRKILTFIEEPKRAREMASALLPSEFSELLRDVGAGDRQSFENWSIRRRHQALRFMEWLTADWPYRFVDLLKNSGVRHTALTGVAINAPIWLIEALEMVYRPSLLGLPKRRPTSAALYSLSARYSVSTPVYRLSNNARGISHRKGRSLRWSPCQTVRVVHMLDARILAMRGAVGTKVRFLQTALATVTEQAAWQLLPTSGMDADAELAQAMRTAQAWKDCLQIWSRMKGVGNCNPLHQPAARFSSRRISEWLAPAIEQPQLSLIGWTEQSDGGPQGTTL